MKMFPRAQQITLKKMWLFWSESMWAPWVHWVTKEVITSRAKPLEEESATIAIVQSTLLRIVHMKEEKRNPRSLFSRRRGSTTLPRGVVTKLLFMKSTYPRMKKMVMMMSTRAWPLLPCIPSPPPPHQASSTPPTRTRPSPTDASWQEWSMPPVVHNGGLIVVGQFLCPE